MKINYLLILYLFFSPLNAFAQSSSDSLNCYYIELKSGEKLFGKFEIKKDYPLSEEYLQYQDSIKYTKDQIKAFQNERGYFANIKVNSLFGYTEKLIRRTERGKINLYTEYITSYNPHTPIHNYPVHYFSKYDSNIQKANYDNLRDALYDNPLSVKYLNKYKTYGYWGWASIIGSVALSAYGAKQTIKNKKVSIFIPLGVITNIAGWAFLLSRPSQIQEAIKEYNK